MAPKRILLTGVSRGLGRALLDEFARRGHRVAGCARSPVAIEELRRIYGTPHSFAVLDVGDDYAVTTWAETLAGDFGTPDIVVNNAAIILPNAPLWTQAAEDFDRLMRINVSGTANVIRAFLPAMIDRRSGLVVNMSSGWGRSTAAEVASYCASKWAIEGLTRALAAELPEGLAAVALNPGIIDTEMLRSAFGDEAKRYPRPDSWARRAAPFILGLGRADNGQPLTVD